MFGVIVINRIIGTKAVVLIHVKPIVPLAEIVKLVSFAVALSVKPYKPSFSIPFEYIGIKHSSVFSLENTLGLSPPAKIYSVISGNLHHAQPSGSSNGISSSISFTVPSANFS